MYYTDITNPELAYFHNRPVHNFTAKLSDLLTSPLFMVEEIVNDSIYKLYPLFYPGEITSSNSNDRILDNKVIICTKEEKETYLTFISDPTGEIVDYSEYGNYYEIGDQLTTEQFNAYISLLRQNITHSDEIHIKEEVTGVYGTYQFDINNATLIDTGLVITDETIQAQPKVKLTDNVFSNSNYVLKVDVIHYTGANILDDTTSDYKVVDTIEVELVADEWVNIPVTEFQQDYIISLNATVDIDHKKPVIYIPDYELTLTSDKDIIQTDETATLTATLTLDGEALAGETVNFKVYKASDQSLVETLTGTTDSQGVATVSYVGKGTGVLNIKCESPERMILSEIYEVCDCIFYDTGVTGTKNSNWENYGSRLTIVTDSNGTSLTGKASQNGYYFVNGSDKFIFDEYACEFDVLDIGGGIRWYHQTQTGGSANENVFTFDSYITGACTVKIIVSDGVATLYVDDTQVATKTLTTSVIAPYEIGFRTNSGTENTITYKDFKVYPL